MFIDLYNPKLDYITLSWPDTALGKDIAELFHLSLSAPGLIPYCYNNNEQARKSGYYLGKRFYEEHMNNFYQSIGDAAGFFGRNERKGSPLWYLVRSESHANDFFLRCREIFKGYPKITRVDVQVTIDKVMPLAQFTGHENSTGWRKNETLYLNNRDNPRFYRIYHKPVDDGMTMRFEMELKGVASQQYKTVLFEHDDPANYIYSAEFENMLSRLPLPLADMANQHIRPILNGGTKEYVRRKKTDRLKWITEQVRPALLKAVCQDDLRQAVLSLAYDIININEAYERVQQEYQGNVRPIDIEGEGG